MLAIMAAFSSFGISSVQAEQGNILTNGDFETGDALGWTAVSGTIEVKAEAAHTGEYGVHVVHNDGVKSNAQVLRQTLSFDAGDWYYMTAWIKAVEAPGELEASVRFRTSTNGNAFEGKQQDGLYAVSQTEWTKLENIVYVYNDCISQFYIRAGNSGSDVAYDYYADDLQLSKISLNEVTNVPLGGVLTINGPSELNLTCDKVKFESGGTVTGVKYNDESAVWEISYRGLPYDSTNGIKLYPDISNKVELRPVFYFTTIGDVPVTENILSHSSRDYDFEKTPVGATVLDNGDDYANVIGNATSIYGGAYRIVEGTGAEPAYSGNQYLEYAERSRESYHRFNNVLGVSDGNTYLISFYARLANEEDSCEASVYMREANLYANYYNIDPSNPDQAERVPLTHEWQRVSAYVTVVRNTEMDEGVELIDKGIHIGARFSGDADVHIDKYEVRKLTALDYNNSLYATVYGYDDGIADNVYNINLDVLNMGSDKIIYFVAIKYNQDGSMSDFKYANNYVSENEISGFEIRDVTDDYHIFIWDGEFKPLNKELLASYVII
ncbi:MAG: carbohydrate binding domain-containing protein [Clostridia bacterium]|nr:carbohydrate binding domain-containing protein [Clostridia bacterium]